MRDLALIAYRSPCETNFHENGPMTIAEADARGEERCPNYDACYGPTGQLDAQYGHQCLLRSAVDAARMCLPGGIHLNHAVGKFKKEVRMPPKGFVWSSDRKTFAVIKDYDVAVEKLRAFARQVIAGPTDNTVGTTFIETVESAVTPAGSIDLAKLEALGGRFGYNGGRACDVEKGHCSCGACHDPARDC